MIFTEQDTIDFTTGINLFNEQHFWHAHESWEAVWRRHPEQERLFLQGLIQLAAAYHHYITRRSFVGMVNNFKKAQGKLEQFAPEYCNIQVIPLLEAIKNALQLAEQSQAQTFDDLEKIILPIIAFSKQEPI